MNHDDVIRLAKEAGLYVGKNASGVTLVGHKYQRFDNTGMLVHMDVKDMAKFAELIVAECEKAIRAEIAVTDISGEVEKAWEMGMECGVYTIKKHFGVEE